MSADLSKNALLTKAGQEGDRKKGIEMKFSSKFKLIVLFALFYV